jgi:hypothetical protein
VELADLRTALSRSNRLARLLVVLLLAVGHRYPHLLRPEPAESIDAVFDYSRYLEERRWHGYEAISPHLVLARQPIVQVAVRLISKLQQRRLRSISSRSF